MSQNDIAPLERQYFDNEERSSATIPALRNFRYGEPLFRVELAPSNKKKGRYSVSGILIGIPHLESLGSVAWRKIACNTSAVELPVNSGWNLAAFCPSHRQVQISIYPPNWATKLCIDDLWSGISVTMRWSK